MERSDSFDIEVAEESSVATDSSINKRYAAGPSHSQTPSDLTESSNDFGVQRRRKRTAIAIGVTSLLTLAAVVCVALYFTDHFNFKKIRERRKIENKLRFIGNDKTVASILNSMDLSVDPCTDFYEYSCGNWETQHPRPVDLNQPFWSAKWKLIHQTAEHLHEALMVINRQDDETSIKMKSFYQECINGPKAQRTSTIAVRESCLKELRISKHKNQRTLERIYLRSVSLDDNMIAGASNIMENLQNTTERLMLDSNVQWTNEENDRQWKNIRWEIKDNFKTITSCIGYFKDLLNGNHNVVAQTDINYDRVHLEHFTISREQLNNVEFKDIYGPPTCYWQRPGFEPVGAFNLIGKSVEISYPLLQQYYGKNFTNAMTYGTLGQIIAHEMAHSIPIKKFQREGNMGEAVNCIVNQYNQFSEEIPETKIVKDISIPKGTIKVNGSKTLAENFFDNVGLKAAYEAFKALSKLATPTDVKVVDESDEYSDDKLFFLSYAQLSCSGYSPSDVGYEILEEVHSPSKFRLLGTLRNSVEFAEAFKCPKDSPMYPIKRCKLF